MNNITKIAIIAVVTLSTLSTSCKKLLETKPSDFLSPVNYYKTADDLQNALNGVYDILGTKSMFKTDMLYAFNAQTDEETFNLWLSSGGLAHCFYEYSSSTPEIGAFWGTLYAGISRANTLLDNIDKPSMNEERRKVIKGEALFLRAYYYFVLAANFGDVPLITKPTTSVTNVDIARTPLKLVYAQILSDMTQAEALLSTQTVTKLGYSGKATKTAAQGMLARICLQMAGQPLNDKAKYQDAKAWSYKVITSGEHILNPDYSNIFIKLARDEYDVKESIWEVEFWGNGTGGLDETNQATGNFIGILCFDESVGYSAARVNVTKKLFDAYEVINPAVVATIRPTLDLRRDWNCANYNYGSTTTAKYAAVTNPWLMNAGKWRREYEITAPKAKTNGMNVTMLRYSDILLMYAEAANELNGGPTDSAYKAINLVRQRGYGKLLNGNVLKSVTVNNVGVNYDTAPTVTFSGGGATVQATATAVINATTKKITAINIITRGQFYQSAPTITISGGNGTGATATATISSMNDADVELGMGKEEFFDLIVNERMRELCFEGHRRLDLIRWGLFVTMMKDFNAYAKTNGGSSTAYRASGNITGRNIFMPIPSNDLTLNKLLTQNPGW
ncbi:RagB/SusD family nutrient uptake outer membrane protein [Pedobacter nyackensis]|uniref:Starch-binding associating with outer membrane n=1 Tax=Pedobacter nyackensis TaxID=475255 RepID=A0A1W1ZZG5_9SPHI|nr:RagB/SusD family nutrient uptake outer membrane protein [Pedobacter nyackensis]SMC53879.1 Starch-binding associating with outer membrane [Pedobacter nyackensis]